MMMHRYMSWVCTVVVCTLIALSVGDTGTNEERLANPELPPQPLTDIVHKPLATAAVSSTTPAPPADPYAEVNSKTITVTVTFPPVPVWQSCAVKISVVGKGIRDWFRGPCWVGGAFSINRDDLMIWGDPTKTPITLYSDRPGTMVVVFGKDSCLSKKYKFENGKAIISRNKMSEPKCKEILDKIQENMEESNRIASPEITKLGMAVPADIKKDTFTSKNSQSELDYVCQKSIKVTGRGVADTVTVACTAIKDPKMITFKDGMLIGNPLKDEFCWFSEAWGTSVFVNGEVCTLRRYGVKSGFMKITLSNISTDECTAAKKRMAEKRSKVLDGLQELTENFKHKIGSLLPAKLW